jgi:hypothetical protein
MRPSWSFLTFGISADCESMPDLGVLAHGIEVGLEELVSLANGSNRKPDLTGANSKHLTHT